MYKDIKFHYAAGSMGWGNGRFRHRFISLPEFPPNVSGSIPDKAVATIQFYYIFEMLGHFDKRIENQFFYLSSAAYLH